MSGASIGVWIALTTLSLCDMLWCRARGLSFAHWWPLLSAGAALVVVALVYRLSGRFRCLAAIAEWTLLWVVFSVAGAILTYLAAARGGPLHDATLVALDLALGFDWFGWYSVVLSHPALKLPLAIAYGSLSVQILFSVFWFALRGWDRRNAELLANVTLALLLTTAVFLLFPTLGPSVGMPALYDAYIEDLVGLRSGHLPPIDVMLLKGVIAFPSFHAVLAVLFTYAHRRSAFFVPMASLNAVMLVSIPSEGGHYLVDVIGGVGVAIVAILALRAVPVSARALVSATSA